MPAAILLAAALAVSPGIWSSYHVHRETGDELGMELQVLRATAPSIRLTLCEGACSLVVTLPITPTLRGFRFDYPMPTGPSDPAMTIHFDARRHGRSLIVRQIGGYDDAPQTLRPIASPRALALPLSVRTGGQ